MTRIDFHSNVPDKIHYACRLVRKAMAQAATQNVVLMLEDRIQLNQLDEALWTFSASDFLPHVSMDHPLAGQTPIILCDGDPQSLPHHRILINLARKTPPHFARFERLFEIINQDQLDAQAGRQRYSFYKQNGYTLNHVVAEAT
jgi:DNA polymerase-3 subunit chi